MQGEKMGTSGVVTSIRGFRAHDEPASESRMRTFSPHLAGPARRGPRTREEIVKFQLDAIDIVAPKLKEGLHPSEARDIDEAVESAKTKRGVWPKAEFLAQMRTPGLFEKALQIFGEVEAFRAVA